MHVASCELQKGNKQLQKVCKKIFSRKSLSFVHENAKHNYFVTIKPSNST